MSNLIVKSNLLSVPVESSASQFDTARMAVTATWSTPRQDGDGDIVIPSGIDLSDHKPNPVILFAHQMDRAVAKAESPEKNYAVAATEDALIGTAYFTQNNAFSYELFGLYAEEILRGWSIGFKILEAERAPTVSSEGKQGLLITKSRLFECSVAPVPTNGDSLTIAVQKCKVTDPLLLQNLRPYLKERTMFPSGFKAQLVSPDDGLSLQSVLAPVGDDPNDMSVFKALIKEKGFKTSQVQTVQLGDDGSLGFAAVQIPAEQCDGEPVLREIDKAKGLMGVYARKKSKEEDPGASTGTNRCPSKTKTSPMSAVKMYDEDEEEDKEQMKGRLKRRTFKRVKSCRAKLRRMVETMDDDDPNAPELSEIVEVLNDLIEEFVPVEEDKGDDEDDDEEKGKKGEEDSDDDEEKSKGEGEEDDDEEADEESLKMLADIDAKLAELAPAKASLGIE